MQSRQKLTYLKYSHTYIFHSISLFHINHNSVAELWIAIYRKIHKYIRSLTIWCDSKKDVYTFFRETFCLIISKYIKLQILFSLSSQSRFRNDLYIKYRGILQTNCKILRRGNSKAGRELIPPKFIGLKLPYVEVERRTTSEIHGNSQYPELFGSTWRESETEKGVSLSLSLPPFFIFLRILFLGSWHADCARGRDYLRANACVCTRRWGSACISV